MNYGKILMSLGLIAFVGAVAIGGTQAMYSDVESSTGNTFTAGDVDLQIGNDSYYSALSDSFDGTDPASQLPENDQNTFSVDDLNDGQVFFAFNDLKPGDLSEDTITMRVDTNDSYMCAYLETTADDDGTCNEPELDDDPQCTDDGQISSFDGELGEELNFAFWIDDGDNVFEDDETVVMDGNAASAEGGLAYALADTNTANLFGDNGTVLEGGEEYHIGKAWCFGELTADDSTALPSTDGGEELDDGPDKRGSGVTCVADDTINNASQTDVVEGIVAFYAVQERNNAGFTCDASLFSNVASEDNRPTVGATAFAYAEPDPTSCDYTVAASGGTHMTVQGAVDAATADVSETGEVVCVDSGTYTEDVTIDSSMTVLGLNDPTGSSKATIDGTIDVESDDVTVSGLEVTNPDASTGLFAQGVNDLEVSGNVFTGIGSSLTVGSAQAVYYKGDSSPRSGITITGNLIENVGNLAMDKPSSGSSAKGIFIGDSTGDATISGLVIENNAISDVKVLTNDFASGGRGAYGVLINYGSGSVGEVIAPVVRLNSIEDLEGLWAHGVGLETETPTAIVERNEFADFEDNYPADVDTAVHFQKNSNSDVTVNFNNFAASVTFGVRTHPTDNPTITVDAENNWWGDTNPADDVSESAGSVIDFTPYQTTPLPLN